MSFWERKMRLDERVLFIFCFQYLSHNTLKKRIMPWTKYCCPYYITLVECVQIGTTFFIYFPVLLRYDAFAMGICAMQGNDLTLRVMN